MKVRFVGELLLAIVVMTAVSCTSDSCDNTGEAPLTMSVQYTDNETSAGVDSLSVFGLGMEMLYDTVSTASVNLPLNPAEDYVSFGIRKGSITDTLTIYYESTLTFLSKACGYSYVYKVSDIVFTTNIINNILIIDRNVVPGSTENLRAFY
jgi:hypothetical protein